MVSAFDMAKLRGVLNGLSPSATQQSKLAPDPAEALAKTEFHALNNDSERPTLGIRVSS